MTLIFTIAKLKSVWTDVIFLCMKEIEPRTPQLSAQYYPSVISK